MSMVSAKSQKDTSPLWGSRSLRPERVLIAFAEESFQESSRLVNPDVRRSVQIYLAEVVLIADDPLFKDGCETGLDIVKPRLRHH